ncbi:hypothetical protein N9B14_02615 [Akkermansiaceae bacterium]|nr:hypothetical protein [Akkermansiaceae bacterium]
MNLKTIPPLLVLASLGASVQAAVLADFDGNGSFADAAFKSAPIGTVVQGGPTGNYYSLLNNIGDAGNHIAFPATGTSGWQSATLSMDIRAADVQADGFGIAFVDVATHGADLVRSGAGGLNDAEERAAYANSVGVGFRTFNGTNATVNYNGAESADAAYQLPQGEWIPVEISMVRDGAGAAISASINGESVFSDYALAGAPDDFRVQIAGRTGGSAMTLDLDNVELVVDKDGDADEDGLSDLWEEKYGLSTSDDGSIDVNNGPDGDPDSDGLTNLVEQDKGTDPQNDDSDEDGVPDGVEDGSGVFVSTEQTGTDPLSADTDGDGLSDGVENPLLTFVDANQPGTDPNKADTDGDGLSDGIEILSGRNPTVGEGVGPTNGVLLADFDSDQVAYDPLAVRTPGFLAQTIVEGGPSGSYYHLLDGGEGDAGNYLSFESPKDTTGWRSVQFSMDYRVDRMAADGWSVAFLDIPTHGDALGVRAGSGGLQDVEERGLYSNSIGVGFRTFNGTNATVNYNGVQSNDVAYTQQQGDWGSLDITMQKSSSGNVTLDATIYPEIGLFGGGQKVFDNYVLNDVELEQFRVQIGGRTGGSSMDLDVDNIRLNVLKAGEGDADGDGLADIWENQYNLSTDDDGSIDPNNGPNGDPDNDGLTNLEENDLGTSPINDDTDADGYKDAVEDNGGVFVSLNQTGTSPVKADTDDDGLLDGVENPLVDFVDANQTGTDPNAADTDEDGVSDGVETASGRNPTVPDTTVTGNGIIADFDLLGEAYTEEARRQAPLAGLRPGDANSDGAYYQVLNDIGSAGNFISFESSEDYTGWETFSFQMDYLATEVEADGWGINFLSTDVHGDSGVVPIMEGSAEETALIDNSFGVGFKTFQATEAQVTWNGIDQSGVAPFNLTTDTWASLAIDVERDPVTKDALVDVTLYDQPGLQGNAESVYADFPIEGMDLEDFRVQVQGRTGGSPMNLSIDNLKLLVDGAAGGGSDLEIISIATEVVNDTSLSVTITWNSREGQVYAVLASDDLSGGNLLEWEELDDSYNAAVGQETTSFTETNLPLDTKRRFYIVRESN